MAGSQSFFLSNFSIFFFFFFIFFSSTTHAALLNLDHYNPIMQKKTVTSVNVVFHHLQESVEMKKRELIPFSVAVNNMDSKGYWMRSRRIRTLLSEPGSWPPRCISRCGQCMPCNPVHVSVPPGTPVTAEYYPVAWRCKCGNKLYMP